MLESIGALIIFPQKIVSLDGAHYMTGRNEQTGARSLSKWVDYPSMDKIM